MSREKYNIEGYVEMFSIQLAGRIIILAEKIGAEEPFLIASCKWDNPLGVDEFYNGVVTSDYLEAVKEFIQRESELLTSLEEERASFGLPFQTMTAADCIKDGMDKDLEGKVLVVKPEALAHEYRTAEHQLVICEGGNGARPNAMGRGVFCKNLYDDKRARHERHQIAGVIDPAKMPEWAKTKLVLIYEKETHKVNEKPISPVKPSLLENLETAKETLKKISEETKNITPQKVNAKVKRAKKFNDKGVK